MRRSSRPKKASTAAKQPHQLHMRHVVDHHRALQSQLSALASSIGNDTSKDDALRQLETMQKSINGIGKYLSFTIPTIIYTERRANASKIAENTLGIPEILESVLIYTHPLDIVNAHSTCRAFRDIIGSSPKLQRALLLRPADSPIAEHIDVKLHPLSSILNWFDLELDIDHGLDIKASLTPENGQDQLPPVGDTFKKMLLCQPPINKICFASKCHECGYYGPEDDEWYGYDYSTLWPAGEPLRFGHLYDKANEIFRDEWMCRDCGAKDLDSFRVFFKKYDMYEDDD